MPDDDQPQAEPAADADAPVPPTQPLRESPPSDPGRRRLRGTGSGFGHTDDPGGMAAEFARRVREAAEQRRPAIERTARDAIERAREAADAARPQIERLAQQAKHAAEAARPHVEQAARDASAFASEHEAELRAAAGRAAQVAGRMAVPPVLRPFVDAAERELHRDASPPPSAPPTSTPPQSTPPRSTQSGPVEEPPAGGERNA
ncbi:MAG: hypothetical protein EXR63_03995 [Dehalococcoidia bacterium]|nr:hypothetical protein [Dehalococcoidia bacterium]